MCKKLLTGFIAGLFLLYGATTASAALQSHYAFNGNANDSVGGYHGTIYGDTTLVMDRFGNTNSAYAFDGIGDYIDIGDAALARITSDFTITAWIRHHTSYYTPTIISKFNGNTNKATVSLNQWGGWNIGMYLGLYDTSVGSAHHGGTTTSNPLLPLGTPPYAGLSPVWNHVAMTYNDAANTMEIFVNGEIEKTVYHAGGSSLLNDPSTSMIIGATLGGAGISNEFKGIIDEVKIYNTTLSQGEIQTDMNAVPLPPAVLMLGAGLAGILGIRRKNKAVLCKKGGIEAIPPFASEYAVECPMIFFV